MKKKGFTLAELLGVIVILGMIAVLVIPVVDKNLKQSKQDLYNMQIESIEKASKNWVASHMMEIPEGDTEFTIHLSDLKAEGLIDKDIKNPVTKKQFPDTMEIRVTITGNQYTYKVMDK